MLDYAIHAPEGPHRDMYLHAAIMLGFAALEAQLSCIGDELADVDKYSTLDRSVLLQRSLRLEGGTFALTKELRLYPMTERLLFCLRHLPFGSATCSPAWWPDFTNGVEIRNRLTHPKALVQVSVRNAQQTLKALLSALDALYRAAYKTSFPESRRGLTPAP